MNKTWQLRAFALYLGVLAPLAASCAKEANTLEDLDEGDDDTGGSSAAGSSNKAGSSSKAGTTSGAFGGTGGKSGSGTAGKAAMSDGGEPSADGGEGTGTGGSAGSSGGGMSGSGGGGGSGGTPGVPPDVLANASVVLHYLTDQAAASSQKIFMKMFLENKSDDPLPLANVKVRYWFTSEAASPQVQSFYHGGNINGQAQTFVLDAANSHVLITFTGNSIPKGNTDPILNASEFQLQIEGGGTQNQSNDWSWQPAYTSKKPHDKITVYLADKLIWGCEPSGKCFDDDLGAGGMPGAGGAN